MRFLLRVSGFCLLLVMQWNAGAQDVNLVNSSSDESHPIISSDGNVLFITRKLDPRNTGGVKDPGDIWYSVKNFDGSWAIPVRMSAPINTPGFNAVLGFTNNGKTMILHGSYHPRGKRPGLDGLAVSHFHNGRWTAPESLDINYFLNKSNHQSGSISPGGNIIVLSLESFGSMGAEDLYVMFYENGRWTDPKNLGGEINTKFQEYTPFLAPDTRSIYFASNGHAPNFGSMDIYVSERLDDTWIHWSKPHNLGPGINTVGREAFYQIDFAQKIGLYTSTQNSDGYGDVRLQRLGEVDTLDLDLQQAIAQANQAIADTLAEGMYVNQYEAPEPEERADVRWKGRVFKEATQQPVSAEVYLIDLETRAILNRVETGTAGEFNLDVPALDEYILSIRSPGYLTTEEQIIIENNKPITVPDTYYLTPIEVGKTIVLENVLFEQSTANMLESSYDDLERVVQFMNENPGVKIELAGHTDNQGISRLNLKLSQERVDVVKQYLVDRGIDEKRIEGKGYGGTKPIASNANPETRKLNRRVEFTIVEIDGN